MVVTGPDRVTASLKTAAVSSAEESICCHSIANDFPPVLPAPLFGKVGLSLS